jgi:hypothetical protein
MTGEPGLDIHDPEQPSILDVMAGLLADFPEPVSRELHVAEPVWRFLRNTYARNTYAKVIPPEAVTAMMGLPVVVDDALTGGQWQIHENGQVTSSGDMAPAPDGMVVVYSPHAGWLAIAKNLAHDAVTGTDARP